MEKRLPLIKIQLVQRLCGSLCTAGGMLGRFEKGPSLEPRLYKLSFVLSCCSKQKFTNVRTGSRAGAGKWRPASSCDRGCCCETAKGFLQLRERKRRSNPWYRINAFSLQAVVSSVPVATAALEGSRKTCECISFLEGLTVSFDVLFLNVH